MKIERRAKRSFNPRKETLNPNFDFCGFPENEVFEAKAASMQLKAKRADLFRSLLLAVLEGGKPHEPVQEGESLT